MRHHIVHGYHQVRKDILRNIIPKDLKSLKEQVLRYLNEFDNPTDKTARNGCDVS